MKPIIFMFLSVCLLTQFATGTFAETGQWEIDMAHSGVYFDARHTYATVRGKFEDFSGTVRFDPANLPASSVAIEVNTKSINTGIPNRDDHLRSEEFFAVNDFPAMTFQSTAVRPKDTNLYTLEGILTIKGITMKVAVPLTYFGTRENPLKRGQQVAGFEARFSIDRLDFKVGTGKYYNMGVIGNKVDVLIALEVLKNN